ncbi:hypothetical protein ACK3TF_004744 [Chlorella vulgaris]
MHFKLVLEPAEQLLATQQVQDDAIFATAEVEAAVRDVRSYQVLLGEQQASQIRRHCVPAAKPCRSQPAVALAQHAAAAAEGHIAPAEDALTLWLLDALSNCNAKGCWSGGALSWLPPPLLRKPGMHSMQVGKRVQEGMQLEFAHHSEEAAGCPDVDIIDTCGSSGSGDCVLSPPGLLGSCHWRTRNSSWGCRMSKSEHCSAAGVPCGGRRIGTSPLAYEPGEGLTGYVVKTSWRMSVFSRQQGMLNGSRSSVMEAWQCSVDASRVHAGEAVGCDQQHRQQRRPVAVAARARQCHAVPVEKKTQ